MSVVVTMARPLGAPAQRWEELEYTNIPRQSNGYARRTTETHRSGRSAGHSWGILVGTPAAGGGSEARCVVNWGNVHISNQSAGGWLSQRQNTVLANGEAVGARV